MLTRFAGCEGIGGEETHSVRGVHAQRVTAPGSATADARADTTPDREAQTARGQIIGGKAICIWWGTACSR
jgi:hypothetical protein